jgi:hypothetical protein
LVSTIPNALTVAIIFFSSDEDPAIREFTGEGAETVEKSILQEVFCELCVPRGE